jgi:hypothetical protein
MTTPATIPLGALLAAEHAYTAIGDAGRADPATVAEMIIRAAVPFLAPALAQMGRGRLTPEASHTAVSAYLRGTQVADLADLYAVTPQTIRRHITRHLDTIITRHRHGVTLARIAIGYHCSPQTLRTIVEERLTSRGERP